MFFSSSDDEVASISSEWNSTWGNQISAVECAMDVFSEQEKYNFVIRVHPNQGNKSRRDKKAWDQLVPRKNCYIFSYSESVDSYELMRRSVAVLTHGSTMGVEAAYRRKRQAFLSPTRFDQLVPAVQLKEKVSLQEWVKNLEASDSLPSEREYEGALLWANYMLTAGSDWHYLEISKKSERIVGSLGGISLRPRTPFIVLTRLYIWSYRTLIENRLNSIKRN